MPLFQVAYTDGAPGRTRTCYPRLSLPTTPFDAALHLSWRVLWSGLSLHHLRCRTYSLYGTLQKPAVGLAVPDCRFSDVSTLSVTDRSRRTRSRDSIPRTLARTNQAEPSKHPDRPLSWRGAFFMLSTTIRWVNHRFPRDCHQHDLLRFPRYSAMHFMGSVSPQRLLNANPQIRAQRPMLYPDELRAHSLKLVGVERFELPTSCSQSRRATRLRYTPVFYSFIKLPLPQPATIRVPRVERLLGLSLPSPLRGQPAAVHKIVWNNFALH